MSAPAPSRLRSGLELVGALTLAFGSKAALQPVIWKFAGPISLGFTLLICTLYLHWRGESWKSLGLHFPRGVRGWAWLLPQTLLAVVAILAAGVLTGLAGEALGLFDMEATQAGVEARWGDVPGNLKMYLLWLAIVWTSAAFGEEMFFRGVLISRGERMLGGGTRAAILAVFIAALAFGLGHAYYQGIRGLFTTGMIAMALGLLYLGYKRSLAPLILAHGAVDTLGFTAMYLGADW